MNKRLFNKLKDNLVVLKQVKDYKSFLGQLRRFLSRNTYGQNNVDTSLLMTKLFKEENRILNNILMIGLISSPEQSKEIKELAYLDYFERENTGINMLDPTHDHTYIDSMEDTEYLRWLAKENKLEEFPETSRYKKYLDKLINKVNEEMGD